MWVEFVVGSHPCSERFSLGTPVFLPPQKPTLANSNSIWDAQALLKQIIFLPDHLDRARVGCLSEDIDSLQGILGKMAVLCAHCSILVHTEKKGEKQNTSNYFQHKSWKKHLGKYVFYHS